MIEGRNIIEKLPYKTPFLFVETIDSLDENGISGTYQFKEDEFYYQGHFPGKPVTPGVILTEVAAQIGLVSLGIYLLSEKSTEQKVVPMFSNATIDFFKPVFPGEKVTVQSKKEYFRFNKLKCQVTMTNQSDELILKGFLSGMIVPGE